LRCPSPCAFQSGLECICAGLRPRSRAPA
jgi:hypothetical protein